MRMNWTTRAARPLVRWTLLVLVLLVATLPLAACGGYGGGYGYYDDYYYDPYYDPFYDPYYGGYYDPYYDPYFY